jgi:3-isopropylmalate dehydrogenase
MKTYNIGVLPGDGTGPEVVAEALKALRAISDAEGIEFNLTHYDIGGERYLAKGDLLPDSVLKELRGMDASLLGAIGHPGVRPGFSKRSSC